MKDKKKLMKRLQTLLSTHSKQDYRNKPIDEIVALLYECELGEHGGVIKAAKHDSWYDPNRFNELLDTISYFIQQEEKRK